MSDVYRKSGKGDLSHLKWNAWFIGDFVSGKVYKCWWSHIWETIPFERCFTCELLLNSMFQWEFKSDTALWLSARHASWLPDLYHLCDLYVWYLFVTYQYKRHNWVICIYVQRLSSVKCRRTLHLNFGWYGSLISADSSWLVITMVI